MNIADAAIKRYTTKAYAANRAIPEETMQALLTLLRHSPSSVNSQPWHFVVAGTPEARARIAKGMQAPYQYNEAKVLNASHVIVLCTRTDMDDAHLNALLDAEEHAGRFRDADARKGQDAGRRSYVHLHRFERKDMPHWLEKQVYLALGTLLLAASAEGIDATPMEGFEPKTLDQELGLNERGMTSTVVVSLGYRADNDFNAQLPKSRLPAGSVLTFL